MTTSKLDQIAQQFGADFNGLPIMLKALDDRQLFIVVSVQPDFKLRLSAESPLSKKIDQLGISNETRLGDNELDENFVVRTENATRVAPDVCHLLKQLAPFVEYEQTGREYRLLKEGIEDSTGLQKTLETLSALVEQTASEALV